MEYVMNLLAGLGDHFVLIAVGCIEAAGGSCICGNAAWEKCKEPAEKHALRAREQIFLEKSADGRTSAVSSWKMKENCRSTLPEIWRV